MTRWVSVRVIFILLLTFIAFVLFPPYAFSQGLRVSPSEVQFFCDSHGPTMYKGNIAGAATVNLISKAKLIPQLAEKILRMCMEASITIDSSREIVGTAWYNPSWKEGEEKMIELGKDYRNLLYKPAGKRIVPFPPR